MPTSVVCLNQNLEQAIALDANYALAYTGLAEYYWVSAFWFFGAASDAVSRAKEAALRAIQLDDTLAETHAWLAMAKGMGEFDWVGAEEEFRRALDLNPESAAIHFYYGAYCFHPMGRAEEELREVLRAVELDPLSARYNASLAVPYCRLQRYDLAILHCRNAVELDPTAHIPHHLLANTYMRMGRFEDAIAEAQKTIRLSGENPRTLMLLATMYAHAGRRAEARSALLELTAQCRKGHMLPRALAPVYAALGDSRRALKWLEKGVEERDPAITFNIKYEPWYETLRGHPHYQALLRKMNLEG